MSFSKFILYSFFIAVILLTSCKDGTIQPELFGSISGQVLNAEDSQHVPGASVTTNPPSNAVVTGNDGRFSFENLLVGNYTVSIVKDGYKKVNVTVSVKEDQTAQAMVLLEKDEGNSPPSMPFNPFPSDGATGEAVNLTLSWSATDPDRSDSLLLFDIYLYKSNSAAPLLVASDYSDTSYQVDFLEYSTAYFWQIIVKDTARSVTNGNVWSFQTEVFPDNPIVYASSQEGNYEIYSTGLDGDGLRLTNRNARDWYPRYNPARTKIAFTSDISVEPFIYIMDKDGSNVQQITSLAVTGNNNYGIGFCWSPGGDKVLFSNYDKLYQIDANGFNQRAIATAPVGRHFRESDWSPINNKIAAVTIGTNIYDTEIYLMDVDGTNMTLLVHNQPGLIESPVFSPDGTKILFTRDVSGFEGGTGRQLDSHIFLMNIDGSDTTDLSANKPAGTNDLQPRFSPDGSRIIFTNAVNDNSASKKIWIMDITGNNRQRLIQNGEMPDWR